MKNVAGWYSARLSGPVAFVPRDAPKGSPYDLDAQSILFHEYAHHFMFLNWPNVVFPAWFVEGFAEFHATATFEPNGDVQFGQVPGYRVWSVGDASAISAAKLIQLDPGKLSDDQTDALYSRGWLLTHMLTFDPERKGQLGDYMRALNEGRDANTAAKVFGDLRKLDNDMTRYIGRSTIIVGKIAAAKITIGPIALRTLSDGEAAVMPARLRSTRGVDRKTAQDVVTLARKLAAPFSDDAGAQNELAEAEYDAGNFEAAKTAADRAIAADSKSIHALVYRGMAEAAMLQAASDKDPVHWRTVRRWFVAANKIDPDNPEPLALFYYSYIVGGLTPTGNAEDGLITAYLLAPFDGSLRMNAAAIYLARKDTANARIALLPVAYSPHRNGSSQIALDALKAIDAGDPAAALAALKAGAKPPGEDSD
jgi:tetratricopeptide (TPR) repeat protein